MEAGVLKAVETEAEAEESEQERHLDRLLEQEKETRDKLRLRYLEVGQLLHHPSDPEWLDMFLVCLCRDSLWDCALMLENTLM